MSVKIDLTGKVYGSLEVIRLEVDIPGKKKKWLCKCKKCGEEVIIAGSNLQSGHSTQCKECQWKMAKIDTTKHRQTGTRLYNIWNGMIGRCERSNNKSYKDYGERGIKVCKEWHDSKKFFAWALENGYKEELEIDRKDTDDDYCPENCQWVTRLANANNKRNNIIIEYNGEKRTLSEWARYYNVNYRNLHGCMSRGFSFEEAILRQKTGNRARRGRKNYQNLSENDAKRLIAEAQAEQPKEQGLFGEE